MAGLPGAMVGSNLFGGGGVGSGMPGGGSNWGGMSTQPFGGMFSNPATAGWGTGLPNFAGGFGLPFAQFGGDIEGPTVVGEQGPEIFMPRQSGTIIPNPATQAQMGGGGMDRDMPSGPFMPGMPGSRGPGSPYPMGMPFEGALAGIGAFGKGFQRPGGGTGWQYGGGFG